MKIAKGLVRIAIKHHLVLSQNNCLDSENLVATLDDPCTKTVSRRP